MKVKEYKRVAAACSPPLIPTDVSTRSSNQREVENRATTIEGVMNLLGRVRKHPKKIRPLTPGRFALKCASAEFAVR
jgi:hypothetical protein